MTNTSPSRKPVFVKLSSACVVITFFGLYLYLNSLKAKTDYESVKGTIDYIGDSYEDCAPRATRYIHVTGYPEVFEVFIGKETGDFSPKFEQVDQLQVGDEIIAYHSEATPLQRNSDSRFNKNLEFIDKNKVPYYIRGDKNRIGGLLFMGTGILLLLGLITLKTLKKIA